MADLAALQQAVAAKPDDVGARRALAGALLAAGKLAEAEKQGLEIARRSPGYEGLKALKAHLAAAYAARGKALHLEGKHPEAIAALNKSVALHAPGTAQIHLLLGALWYAEKNREQAIAAWSKAVALDPRCAAAFMNLGKAFQKTGNNGRAIDAYRKALAVQPQHVPTHLELANLLYHEELLEECRQVCEAAVTLDPDSERAVAGLALVLERQGKVSEAYERLLPLIKGGTKYVPAVTAFATVCQRLDPPDPHAVILLEQQVDRPDLADQERQDIYWSLAQVCDALAQPEAAFRYLQQAKMLQKEATAVKKQEFLQNLSNSMNAYTAERLARLPRARHDSQLPVFVVGMPRSGTTLTEQILASHPRVHGAGELTSIIGLARTGLQSGLPYPECLEHLTQDRVDKLASAHLARLRRLSREADRVVDKMPFNFLHLGLIELLFPRTRIIHCVRDPLDTCISIYFNRFPKELAFTQDLATLGLYYRRYREIMRHWQHVLKLRMFPFSYEALVAKPEEQIRRLVEFCGLDWDPACAKFYESKRVPKTFSYHQVRKPLYASSIGRHKAYEPFLGLLKESLGEDLLREAEIGRIAERLP